MMKVLAFVVVIAVIACKGEADTAGKKTIYFKNGSPRTITIEETTMNDPALEQEIVNAIILGAGTLVGHQQVADYVTNHVKEYSNVICLIFPVYPEPKPFAFAYTTTEFMRISDTDDPNTKFYVFKV